MNITINPITINNYKQYNTPNAPAFCGYSRTLHTTLDKMMQKTQPLNEADKLTLIEAIKNAIKSILVPSKFIEMGTRNSVYKITRKYAARVPNEAHLTAENVGDRLIFGQGMFKNLQQYYGEPILSLGKLQILRNLGTGLTAGVPEHIAKHMSRGQIIKYYFKKYLPKYAQIPQSGYDVLAKDLAKLNSMSSGYREYCVFDQYNPNNIVAKRGKLYLVDDICTDYEGYYGNTTGKLLEALLYRATHDIKAPKGSPEDIKLVRKIFKKVVIAGEKANLLPAENREDFEVWQEILKLCSIETPADKVLNFLENNYGKHRNTPEHLENVINYINKLFTENPIVKN